MPQGRVTLDTLKAAEAHGYGARDMAAILGFIREAHA
jgi:3-hydroxyisobutyrate dehydrogenase